MFGSLLGVQAGGELPPTGGEGRVILSGAPIWTRASAKVWGEEEDEEHREPALHECITT